MYRPHGLGLLHLLRTAKSMVSHPGEAEAKHTPKSFLEKKEDDCRRKLGVVSDTENKMGISLSHMKGLPTVLVANGIAVLVTRELNEPLNLIAGCVFVAFLVMLVIMVIWYLILRKELPTLRRQLANEEREYENSRRIAYDMFRHYKSELMPDVTPRALAPSLFSENGKVSSTVRCRTWRNPDNITVPRQHDMEYLDRYLFPKMDFLGTAAEEFYDAVDILYEACESKLMNWISSLKGTGPSVPTDRSYLASALIALYRVHSESIKDIASITSVRDSGLMNDIGVIFLTQHYFAGTSPSTSPIRDSLMKWDDLPKMVDAAETARKKAHEVYDEVLADLRYGYSGET